MTVTNQDAIKEFVAIGKDIKGHRVSGKDRAEVKENISKVFANARKRSQQENIVG